MKNDRIYTKSDMLECWKASKWCTDDDHTQFDKWIETHNKSYTTEKKKYVEEELPDDPTYIVDIDMDKCPQCGQDAYDGRMCHVCGSKEI